MNFTFARKPGQAITLSVYLNDQPITDGLMELSAAVYSTMATFAPTEEEVKIIVTITDPEPEPRFDIRSSPLTEGNDAA